MVIMPYIDTSLTHDAAVGSVGNNGLHSPYSEPGANVVVTAPSNSYVLLIKL